MMILRAIHLYFEHVRGKLLIDHNVPSMVSTRLLLILTLQSRNVQELAESSIMVPTRGRGGCGGR